MSLQFTTVSQFSANKGVKTLVYGEAGMGKTVLSATLPGVVILSAEAGVLSLSRTNLERIFGSGREDIDYDVKLIPVTTVADLTQAYSWLASPQAADVQSVVIDSLTEIGDIVLQNALSQVKDPRQAYNELLRQMKDAVRMFRDLPKHVLVTTHMAPLKDELTGVVKFGPDMPGKKLARELPHYFDEVYRIGVSKDAKGESYRFLQTQPDMQYLAKSRGGGLDAVEYPHMGMIINKLSQ